MNISRPFLTKSSEKFFSSPEYYIEERTRLTSPVAFSMFPKFSNILLQSIPSKHLKNGLSYSTLLNFQKNEIIQQSTTKKKLLKLGFLNISSKILCFSFLIVFALRSFFFCLKTLALSSFFPINELCCSSTK